MDRQSASIKELATALTRFQSQAKPIAKDHANPHFKSRYADLNDCWQAIRAPLAEAGLAVAQTTELRDGCTVMITTLIHVSGEWIRGEYPVTPLKADPQSLASAHTYARRYSLCAILGLTATEDDDDGNSASDGNANGAKPAKDRLDALCDDWCSKYAGASATGLPRAWADSESARMEMSKAGRTDLVDRMVKVKDQRKAAFAAAAANNGPATAPPVGDGSGRPRPPIQY